MDFTRKRHPRQRFDASASFVWLRQVIWDGKRVEAGSPVPSGLNRNKLRALWDARHIQLAGEFHRVAQRGEVQQASPSTSSALPVDDLFLSVRGRGRYTLSVTRGDELEEFACHGKKALQDQAQELGIGSRVEALLSALQTFEVDSICEQSIRAESAEAEVVAPSDGGAEGDEAGATAGGGVVGEADALPASSDQVMKQAIDKLLSEIDFD
jgi:hypothetical protein